MRAMAGGLFEATPPEDRTQCGFSPVGGAVGGLFEAEVNLAPMPPAGRHAAPLQLLPVARHRP